MSGREAPAAVRSSSYYSDRIHRTAEGSDRTPACNQPNRSNHVEWIRIEPVTSRLLAFRDLCRHCWPALKGSVTCGACSGELEYGGAKLTDGCYRVTFDCPICGEVAALELHPERGNVLAREGVAKPEQISQPPVAPDGGAE